MAATTQKLDEHPKRGHYARWDYDALSDLLHEIAPEGLTDDAPIRRAMREALDAHAEDANA